MKTKHLTSVVLAGVTLLTSACGGSGSSVDLPDAPDAALEAIAGELAEGNAGALWQALPAGYKTDLTELAHTAGAVLDPDLYDQSFALVGRVADVVEKQHAFLLNSQFTQGMNVAQAEATWKPAVKLLRTLSTSELSSVAGLQSIDLGGLLDGTGSEVLALVDEIAKLSGEDSPLSSLADFSAEVVEADASSATLRMSVPGEPEQTQTFSKVEDRWVPADLANEWSSQMDEARARLEELAGGAALQNKPQILGALAMVEGVLGQLEAAESQEQFDQALQGAMMPIMGLMMMGGGMNGGIEATPPAPPMPSMPVDAE